MPERLNGAVSKTVVGLVVYRGFESLSLLLVLPYGVDSNPRV